MDSSSGIARWPWRKWFFAGAALAGSSTVVGPVAVEGTYGCGSSCAESCFSIRDGEAFYEGAPPEDSGSAKDGGKIHLLSDASDAGVPDAPHDASHDASPESSDGAD
jgi:hypothetical protein